MALLNTWQQVDAVAEALLDRLRPAYIPGQLDLFSSRNQVAVGRANSRDQETPPLLRVGDSRHASCQVADEEELAARFGRRCTSCED